MATIFFVPFLTYVSFRRVEAGPSWKMALCGTQRSTGPEAVEDLAMPRMWIIEPHKECLRDVWHEEGLGRCRQVSTSGCNSSGTCGSAECWNWSRHYCPSECAGDIGADQSPRGRTRTSPTWRPLRELSRSDTRTDFSPEGVHLQVQTTRATSRELQGGCAPSRQAERRSGCRSGRSYGRRNSCCCRACEIHERPHRPGVRTFHLGRYICSALRLRAQHVHCSTAGGGGDESVAVSARRAYLAGRAADAGTPYRREANLVIASTSCSSPGRAACSGERTSYLGRPHRGVQAREFCGLPSHRPPPPHDEGMSCCTSTPAGPHTSYEREGGVSCNSTRLGFEVDLPSVCTSTGKQGGGKTHDREPTNKILTSKMTEPQPTNTIFAPSTQILSSKQIELQLATANVNTLLPHQESCSYARTSAASLFSKVEMLETQFCEHSLDVIGIQEGRSRNTGLVNGLHFIRIGRGGRFWQLWCAALAPHHRAVQHHAVEGDKSPTSLRRMLLSGCIHGVYSWARAFGGIANRGQRYILELFVDPYVTLEVKIQ